MARANTLVVDDEPSVVNLIVKVLSKEGYVVKSTLSAQDAVEITRRERFDLLLIDIMMPGIDGLELLQRLHETCPGATMVIITGYATLDLAIKSLKEEVQGFIAKPFTAKELRTEIAKAIKKSRLIKETKRETRRRKGE